MIQHSDDSARWLQSTPAGLRDLLNILQTSAGKPPAGLFKNSGGQSLSQSVKKGILKKSGSTAEGLSFWSD